MTALPVGPARLTAAIHREGEQYVSQCLEVDVASCGASIEEALANLREAVELYLEETGAFQPPVVFVAPFEVGTGA